MTHDGRIAYKRRGADQKEALESQMVVHYVTIIRLVAQARILPALDVLHLDHRFQEAELIRIALVSVVVPRDGNVCSVKRCSLALNAISPPLCIS